MLAWCVQLVAFIKGCHMRFVNDVEFFFVAKVASFGDGVPDADSVNIPPF